MLLANKLTILIKVIHLYIIIHIGSEQIIFLLKVKVANLITINTRFRKVFKNFYLIKKISLVENNELLKKQNLPLPTINYNLIG